jgi:oxygen-independent coproporphyrinogen III oxidase
MSDSSDEIGIYIHVPYCRVICPYCDFVKKFTRGDVPDGFVDALCREIEGYEGARNVGSIFFGGGTPSLLTREGTEQIFDSLHKTFLISDAEVSIEVNPDDVMPELLSVWKGVGINRLSLGVQSFDDEVLRFLGRCHDSEKAHRACDLIGSSFNNWSLDLIFGCRPSGSWEASLETALGYGPPHISAYGLTYEENTPFWEQRHDAVDDDVSLEQYRRADTVLAGYNHYEVSNFALPGFESTHNQLYWRNESYVGFGPGAVSFLNDVRITNPRSISGYEECLVIEREYDVIDPDDIKLETLIQHFRTRVGIQEDYYESRFSESIRASFGGALDELLELGLLWHIGRTYAPTQLGYELNNEIGLALIPGD